MNHNDYVGVFIIFVVAAILMTLLKNWPAVVATSLFALYFAACAVKTM